MARHGGDLRWLDCPVCGSKTLKPAHVKTCSRECAILNRRQADHNCSCIVCGVEFQHKGYTAAGLCPSCKTIRSGGGSVVYLKCPVCGKDVYRQARFRTCSRECGNILQWEPRKKYSSAKARSLAKSAKRRMLMRNEEGIIENVNPGEIYIRDGGMCGICGEHVDLSEVSIDHVVPLSLGGQHTKENVQLAHFLCNVRRGNKSLEMVKK